MKFKICILIVCLNSTLQASSRDQSLCDVDTQITNKNNQIALHLKKQELIRKTQLLECAEFLASSLLTRIEFKSARNILETYCKDLENSEHVRQELDIIKKNHQRRAPFFAGYVYQKDLNHERLELKRILEASLAKEKSVIQILQDYNPTAPVEAVGINVEFSDK